METYDALSFYPEIVNLLLMCLSPVYLRESKTFVPCGKCGECLKERGSEWRFRLMYQCKLSKLALWCTFTYADANSLSKDHAQTLLRSFDDVFKPVRRIGGKRIRVHSIIMKYYLIGEYGTHTYRPHYHEQTDTLRTKEKDSIDKIFRRMFKC